VDDTVLEVATFMARVRSPRIAVAERRAKGKDGDRMLGVTTTAHLLERLLGAT
jgi:hypothetical protein